MSKSNGIGKRLEIAQQIYSQWEKGYNYLLSMGYVDEIKENVKFVEGKQYAPTTKKTAFIPKTKFNFTKLIKNTLASNILGVENKLECIPLRKEISTERFSGFFNSLLKKIDIESLNDEAVSSALTKKVFCYYFYFDEKSRGFKGNYRGDLACKIIDPLDFIVANPAECDVQKQEYIILRMRESIKSVRKMAKGLTELEKKNYICDDNSDVRDGEEDDEKLITIYVKFFRKNDEVYWVTTTRDIVLHKPIPLNPNSIKLDDNFEIIEEDEEGLDNVDSQIKSMNDDELESAVEEERFVAWRYPIEIGCLEKSDKDLYGIATVTDIIPNQRLVNLLMSMESKNVIDMAWDKVVVKADALRGQTIDNNPGQVIVDHSKGASWGIAKLAGQNQLGNGVFEMCTAIIDITRTLTHGDEYISNDLLSQELSGEAISRIEAIKEKSIDKMRARFWKSLEKIGMIIHQFCITHYDDEPYTYTLSEEEARMRKEMLVAQGNDVRNFSNQEEAIFNGKDFENIPLEIRVQANQTARYSELAEADLLKTLFLNGNIKNMDSNQLEAFVELMPNTLISDDLKQNFRELVETQRNSEVEMLKAQVQELSTKYEQMVSYANQKEKQVEYAKEYLTNLKKAYSESLNGEMSLKQDSNVKEGV